MHDPRLPVIPRAQSGFSLIEALVAILIFSLGILGLVSILAVSVENASQAKYRADASFIANRMIGEMWAGNRSSLGTYAGTYDAGKLDDGDPRIAGWSKAVAEGLQSGSAVVSVNGDTVSVTVSWVSRKNADTQTRNVTHSITQVARIRQGQS